MADFLKDDSPPSLHEFQVHHEPDSDDVRREITVPPELEKVLLDFSLIYLVEKPNNVVDFAVDYFTELQLKRAEKISEDDEDDLQAKKMRSEKIKTRRKSVFAEAYDPEESESDEEEIVTVGKTDEERERILESIKNNLLFRSLDGYQIDHVLDAMFQVSVHPGDSVITQGDDADNFYVIESGVFNVYVDNLHVHQYANVGCFGELALLYDQPRSATVKAETVGKLWAMDRASFRRIILRSAYHKRKAYESLLDSVPMLKALQNYERMNLADALTTKHFQKDDIIIKQGDSGDGMYFVESGTVSVRIDQGEGEVEVSKLNKGQYFGELALVTHRPRAASVYADSRDVAVAFLETEAFERILGFLVDVMRRNTILYEEHLANLARQGSNEFE